MNPESQTICPQCGRKIAAGEECANCARDKVFPLVQREAFLLLLLGAIALGAYFGARAYANADHDIQARLAASWYGKGEQLLDTGHPDLAVAAFRKAIVNDRDKRVYLLALAHALEMDGRDQEADELLRQVRENAPEDPEINVELGRIAMREGNVQDALRYERNALYGIWTGENIDARRIQVRRELIEFLIAHHARDQALAEILALADHLPSTVAARLELGDLFLRAGSPERALVHFRSVLRQEPHNQTALQAAGQASFEIGDYSQARRFLSQLTAPDARTSDTLSVATLVVQDDPLQPRLSSRERERRLLQDFNEAGQNVQACLTAQRIGEDIQPLKSVLDKLDAMRPALTPEQLQTDSNLLFNALELIYEAEDAATKVCGPLHGPDLALWLMAQKNRRAEQ